MFDSQPRSIHWRRFLATSWIFSSLVLPLTAHADQKETLTSKERSLAVLTDVAAPTVDPYYQGQDRITGSVAPEVKKVRLYEGKRYVRTGTITNGTFTIYARDVHPRQGEDWHIVPVDAKDHPGQLATLNPKQSDATVTAIDSFAGQDPYVTGKTAHADVVRLYLDGKEKRAVKVAPDGTFKLYTNDFYIKHGKTLELVALDKHKAEGDTQTTLAETYTPADAVKNVRFGMDSGHVWKAAAFDPNIDRIRFYIDGVLYNTVGIKDQLHNYNVHVYLPNQDYSWSDTAVFEAVSIDQRGREGKRYIDRPFIGIVELMDVDDYTLRVRIGRGTRHLRIKDQDGNVLNEKTYVSPPTNPGEMRIRLSVESGKYISGERYYIYGVDSKGNEGKPSSFVFLNTNGDYDTQFIPAATLKKEEGK